MQTIARRIGSLGALVLVFASVELAFAGDPQASAATLGGDADFNLARLVELEQQRGGGGADETASPTVIAGWDKDKGFFISDSTKEQYLLQIGGLIQARYTFKENGSHGPEVPGVKYYDQSFFEIQRARLYLTGFVLDPKLMYNFTMQGSTDDGGSVKILDAYGAYKLGGALFGEENKEAMTIGVGQWKPYFLRQYSASARRLQMVDRSLATEFFQIGRQIGIWAQGELGPVFYAFALTNGFGSVNTPSTSVDQIPALVGKLDLSIFGNTGAKYEESNVRCTEDFLWTIGASGAFDKNNGTTSTDTQQFTCFTFGLDTVMKWWVFSLQAEYMGRWLSYPSDVGGPGVPGMVGDSGYKYTQGYYVQGGIFIWPEVLEVAARVSGVVACDGGRNGDGVEVGPGLNWYISKSHKVKLQTDLMYFSLSPNMPVMTTGLGSNFVEDPTDPAQIDSFVPFLSNAANLKSGQVGFQWRTQLQIWF